MVGAEVGEAVGSEAGERLEGRMVVLAGLGRPACRRRGRTRTMRTGRRQRPERRGSLLRIEMEPGEGAVCKIKSRQTRTAG